MIIIPVRHRIMSGKLKLIFPCLVWDMIVKVIMRYMHWEDQRFYAPAARCEWYGIGEIFL